MKRIDAKTAYFKRLFYGGRSRAARILDAAMLRVTVFVAAFVVMLFLLRPGWLALLLAAVAVSMFSVAARMINRARFEKFIANKIEELRGEYLIEKLLMMPQEQLSSVVQAYTLTLPNVLDLWEQDDSLLARRIDESFVLVGMLQSHPSRKAGADELLELYRRALECSANGLLVYSTASFAEDAEALSKRLSMPVSLFPPTKLTELARQAQLLPSDEEMEAELDVIIAQRREQMASLRQGAFSKGKARRYLMCAGVLMAATFVTGYYAYYPILAAVCVSLAILTGWLNRQKEEMPSFSIK